jgi:5'(3')-deoxyribonucleotidase
MVLSPNEAEQNDLKQYIHWIYRQAWFYESLQPYKHAIERLRELSYYYHIFICSAPSIENYGCENEKKSTLHRDFEWTELHEQNLFKNIIFTRDKTMVKWDYLIDDKPTIEQWIYTPERKRIILDQSYNQHLSWPRINWSMSTDEIRNVLEWISHDTQTITR